MKLRFTLRRFFALLGILVCILALIGNWHSHSIRQFNALARRGPGDDSWVVELPCELEENPDGSGWRVSPNAAWGRRAFQAWLCHYFEPQYCCDSVVVYVPIGAEISGTEYVGKLKGVSWIVLPNETSSAAVTTWEKQFSNASVVVLREWKAMDSQPNTLR